MNASETALVMLILFLLRLLFPLIVIVIFGNGMNRLMDYWNANIERWCCGHGNWSKSLGRKPGIHLQCLCQRQASDDLMVVGRARKVCERDRLGYWGLFAKYISASTYDEKNGHPGFAPGRANDLLPHRHKRAHREVPTLTPGVPKWKVSWNAQSNYLPSS